MIDPSYYSKFDTQTLYGLLQQQLSEGGESDLTNAMKSALAGRSDLPPNLAQSLGIQPQQAQQAQPTQQPQQTLDSALSSTGNPRQQLGLDRYSPTSQPSPQTSTSLQPGAWQNPSGNWWSGTMQDPGDGSTPEQRAQALPVSNGQYPDASKPFNDASGTTMYKVQDPVTGQQFWRAGQPASGGNGFTDFFQDNPLGRAVAGVSTGGLSEVARSGRGRNALAGTGTGALAGLVTGGPLGAVAGGIGGGVNGALSPDGNPLNSGLYGLGIGTGAGLLSNLAGAGAAAGGTGGVPWGSAFPKLNLPTLGGIAGLANLNNLYRNLRPGAGTSTTPSNNGTQNGGTGDNKGATPNNYPLGGGSGDNFGLGNLLALAGGLGLGIEGLSEGPARPDLTGAFSGQKQATLDDIAQEQQREQGQFGNAIQNYQTSRAQGQQNLDQVLNQGSDQALQLAIKNRMGELNKMGLLNGPSGALDEAVAQEAGKIQRGNIPYMAQYAGQTQTGLDSLNSLNLENALGLQQGGLQRNFGLTDQLTNATLKQQLLDAQMKNASNAGKLGAGITLAGYGMGGLEGANAARQIAQPLERVLNPEADYSYASPYGGSGNYRRNQGSYGQLY